MVAAGSARRGRMFGGALPYILLSPLVVFIGALSFVPTVDTTVEAFFRVSPLNPPTQFTGLGNFRALFASSAVNGAWVNTAVYVVIGVALSVVLGTVIALALRQRFRFRGIVLALVILPWALPAVVEAVIWSWIYDPTFGVMNSALHSAHLIGGYHVWLGLDRWLTIALIEIVQVWQMTPLSAIVILAALQSVPLDLYEAARVDGAGAGAGLLAHLAADDPAGPGRLHGRGADPVAEHFRPGLHTQRDRAARLLGDAADLPDHVPEPQLRRGLRVVAVDDRRHRRALDGSPGAALPQTGGSVMAVAVRGERTSATVNRVATGPFGRALAGRPFGCSGA